LGGTSAQIHLYVHDVDAFVLKALAGGAKLIRPISNYEFGERIGKIVDPFGHVWMVGTRIENVPIAELRKRVLGYKITGKPGS